MDEAIIKFFSEGSFIETVIVICLTCGIGLYLGKIKLIGNINLGGTCVLFIGILLAACGVKVSSEMLLFAQNFGLILFIYALGVQVGPGFVESLKNQGMLLNSISVGIILLGTALVLLCYGLGWGSLTDLMGVLHGAVTNTPALGAAQQSVYSSLAEDPDVNTIVANMSLATAVTYPLGVIGVILALILLKPMASAADKRAKKTKEKKHAVSEFEVTNPNCFGKTIAEIHKIGSLNFTISRIMQRNRSIATPTKNQVISEGDHLLIIHEEDATEDVTALFGMKIQEGDNSTDWERDSHTLVARRLLVSKPEFNGLSLASLKFRNKYGVNVTRISRSEIDLVPAPKLRLRLGDRITVVGPEEKIEALSKVIGNQLKPLEAPYLVTIFIGIALGCLLGMIPITIPGLSRPVALGMAGGPMVMGILMGAYGPRLHINTYITHSANLMLRTYGLTIYLAGLGLASGAGFVNAILHGAGISWIIIGFCITIIPLLLMGFVILKWGRLPFSITCGMLCGAMSNPIALDYLLADQEDDKATVSYATVYPLGMFLRVILAQIIILLFINK